MDGWRNGYGLLLHFISGLEIQDLEASTTNYKP